MTAVHEATLNDLVYPAEIVGKRIRIKLDGSRLVKVHLDKNQQTTVEHKVIRIFEFFYFRKFFFFIFEKLIWEVFKKIFF